MGTEDGNIVGCDVGINSQELSTITFLSSSHSHDAMVGWSAASVEESGGHAMHDEVPSP